MRRDALGDDGAALDAIQRGLERGCGGRDGRAHALDKSGTHRFGERRERAIERDEGRGRRAGAAQCRREQCTGDDGGVVRRLGHRLEQRLELRLAGNAGRCVVGAGRHPREGMEQERALPRNATSGEVERARERGARRRQITARLRDVGLVEWGKERWCEVEFGRDRIEGLWRDCGGSDRSCVRKLKEVGIVVGEQEPIGRGEPRLQRAGSAQDGLLAGRFGERARIASRSPQPDSARQQDPEGREEHASDADGEAVSRAGSDTIHARDRSASGRQVVNPPSSR